MLRTDEDAKRNYEQGWRDGLAHAAKVARSAPHKNTSEDARALAIWIAEEILRL